MMGTLFRSLALVGAVLISGHTWAQPVVDQVYSPNPANGGVLLNSSFEGRPLWLAQSFTAGLSGQLSAVDLAIWRDSGASDNLVFQVFELNGDQTLGAMLGSAAIASTEVAVGVSGSWIPAPGSDPLATHVNLFTQGIQVQLGSAYMLAVSALNPAASTPFDSAIVWIGNLQTPNTIDPYPGGRRFYNYTPALAPGDSLLSPMPLEDFGFRTFVSAVPDASGALLALAGVALIAARVRRRTAW